MNRGLQYAVLRVVGGATQPTVLDKYERISGDPSENICFQVHCYRACCLKAEKTDRPKKTIILLVVLNGLGSYLFTFKKIECVNTRVLRRIPKALERPSRSLEDNIKINNKENMVLVRTFYPRRLESSPYHKTLFFNTYLNISRSFN